MRARALDLWAKKLRPDSWKCVTHEALADTHALYKLGVDAYNTIQRKAPWAHHLYFNALELASMHRNPDTILGGEAFMDLVRREEPDLIVSVHGHTNHGFFNLARRALSGKKPVCVTYCGELFGGYGLSRHWFNPQADFFIGAVPDVCHAGLCKHHLHEAKTRAGGFLLRPPFYDPPLSKEEWMRYRQETLNAAPDDFILLLSTGDAGANNHLRLISALEQARLRIHIVALCGKNETIRHELDSFLKSRKPQSVRVSPLGYREDMHLLMQACSAIVARPGTGATSAAILTGCPLLHNGLGGIMPQEWITVKFCRAYGFDHVFSSPAKLIETVKIWLEHPERLEQTRRRMQKVIPDNTPHDLIPFLEKIVEKKNRPR